MRRGMKRGWIALAAIWLWLVLAAGCAAGESDGGVLAYVVETQLVTVPDNGRWITPGEDARFHLIPAPGYAVKEVRCSCAYELLPEGDALCLVLHNVRYTTRAEVILEETGRDDALRYFRTLAYDPNGGTGEAFSVTVGILTHPRPNTANAHTFTRPGYTLTGWNTLPDGSGQAVGLGSRLTVPPEGVRLYAQWAPWAPESDFSFRLEGGGAVITGFQGHQDPLVIPGALGGEPVRGIAAGAFAGCDARRVALPLELEWIEDGAFQDAELEELTLFDSLKRFSDAAFPNCASLRTLRINAAEDPFGYRFRRESLFADKIDLLITAAGQKKLVFYGGCNVWYNLIGQEAAHRFPEYRVVNLGLNGTVNSLVQMRIITAFLEEGDLFFHAPEISSTRQLLLETGMRAGDDMLWAGIEYNYDLFALADLRELPGALDSLCGYWNQKKPGGAYAETYRDASGNVYLDETGSLPLIRTHGMTRLDDNVYLNPALLEGGLSALGERYRAIADRGARVYVSWACVDLDAVPEAQQGNVGLMDRLFHAAVEGMDGPALISSIGDYLYHDSDFYDTHYHLLTPQAYQNTERWLHDLEARMRLDGLIPE